MDGNTKFSALIKKLTHVMAVEFDRRLKVHNITLAQWGILRQLWEREGRSQVELQERLSPHFRPPYLYVLAWPGSKKSFICACRSTRLKGLMR